MEYSLLIIDDEPHFCSSLQVLLQAEGYHAETANSGKEGLFYLSNYVFDAVLLDIGLPDFSGLELAAHTVSNHPDTAVIILTGSATVDNAVEALRHGVYDFLRKPCPLDSILRTIARAIQHQNLKKALHTSEKRFRQLSQATWEGIIIYNKGILLQTNNQLCEMFGYSEDELIGRQIFDILLDKNSIQALHAQTSPDAIGPFKARGIKKGGQSFPVEIRVKHIDYQGKQVQVAAIRDVTISELALQQKLNLQEQLTDAKRMESLGLMAGSVAHDLNNILAGIITYPELLLLDLDENFKYREEITMVRDAGRRAAAVVDDLLTVARGASCKKEPRNINTIVSGYFSSVEYNNICQRFPEITVLSYLEDRLLTINCSGMHISKSLTNLVNNAAEAIQTRGVITVTTRNLCLQQPYQGYELIEAGEYVVIAVEDDGAGISPEDRAKIFSPFYSKKIMGRSGTGLGLAVVWNTVHDHGGYIDLGSSKAGTLFSLYFPVIKACCRTSVRPAALPTHQGKGQRILVVDDQKSQREIASRLLNRMGYQPYTVPSGEQALEFIKEKQVDLVILDMLMDPGINGCETYRRILEEVPEQKAIITSGYSSSRDVDLARELGITQFIKKPYSLHELGQALQLEFSAPPVHS
ncbi:hybrid sensor histidine kinase/response regulator [Desulfogranum mediterraneum]|uniref:hybrid sensor histidine kinase/response regulator n=1 Tax=Desulfogranum mediterraneum TaxID=160661 RepID=UPI000401CAF3|nr:response regulator [Desulfogranum mediterraneum]